MYLKNSRKFHRYILYSLIGIFRFLVHVEAPDNRGEFVLPQAVDIVDSFLFRDRIEPSLSPLPLLVYDEQRILLWN